MAVRILHILADNFDCYYVYDVDPIPFVRSYSAETYFFSQYNDDRHQDVSTIFLRHIADNKVVQALVNYLHPADPYENSVEVVRRFNDAWAVSFDIPNVARRGLRIAVGGELFNIIQWRSHISFVTDSEWDTNKDIPRRIITYPNYPAVVENLRKILRVADIKDYSARTEAIFSYYFDKAEVVTKAADAKKGNPAPDAPASHKAIMLINGLDRVVVLYTHKGIRLITFDDFLQMVLKPHSDAYQLEKVDYKRLNEMDRSYFERLAQLPLTINVRMGTAYMAFRALWYGATHELMSMIVWER